MQMYSCRYLVSGITLNTLQIVGAKLQKKTISMQCSFKLCVALFYDNEIITDAFKAMQI